MITNYSRLENNCLNRQFITRGNIWAYNEDTGYYEIVKKGQKILTNLRHPNSGTYDPYPPPIGRVRRDRMSKPLSVKRFEIEEWGYTNDWYIV